MPSLASSIDSSLSGVDAATTTPSRFGELTSEDFVKIMFTELSNQDPLKPNDSNTLLQQFSSLRSIEADLALQTKLETVVDQGQLTTAGALLGKHVAGYTEFFEVAEGVVRSISQTGDGPVLNLANGARIPFQNIHSIYEPPASTPNNPTTPTTPGPNPTTPTTNNPPVVPLYIPPNTGTPSGGTGTTGHSDQT